MLFERRQKIGESVLDQDFMSREDGYPGLKKAYNFEFKQKPREMELALTYRALDAGKLDLIVGYSTDGLIDALKLVQLKDDKKYFPPYEAMFVARKSVLETSAALREVFEDLKGAISTRECNDSTTRWTENIVNQKRSRKTGLISVFHRIRNIL